jgi:hypothetical protein
MWGRPWPFLQGLKRHAPRLIRRLSAREISGLFSRAERGASGTCKERLPYGSLIGSWNGEKSGSRGDIFTFIDEVGMKILFVIVIAYPEKH